MMSRVSRARRVLRTVANRLITVVAMAAIVSTALIVIGLAVGYRPVVILTGSMGTTAPPGSLIVARPVPSEQVVPGDILVMRRPGSAPITHRVLEIEDASRYRFAITKGDANEAIDASPYPLTADEQLIARWIRPGLGRWLMTVFRPGPALFVVGAVTLILAFQALRWIWSSPPAIAGGPVPAGVGAGAGANGAMAGTGRRAARRSRPMRRRARRLGVAPLITILTAGIAWALFGSTAAVPSNEFSVAGCTDPHLASVQNGEQIQAVNGSVTVPIDPVDPTRAFVLASSRSDTADAADATARVALAGDGASIEIHRATNAGSPPPITVSWSVVEYACGVRVQRGIATGNDTALVSIPITSVDVNSSFALVSTAAAAGDTAFDGDDLYRTKLGPGALTVETGGPALSSARTFAWQVVSFGDPADAQVQEVDVTLGDGMTVLNATLSTPVDPEATVVFAEPTSSFAGAALNARLVRAELTGPTTVQLTRTDATAGRAVDVRVRVVTFNEGTSVRHGTVDFAPGIGTVSIPVTGFDTSRATALSTVVAPGLSSGGRTDHSADDTVGEASAAFTVVDSTTVDATRDATSSAASFGWQVIEWAGPEWWDNAYLFRQRIEVATTTAAAPDGYTVPVTIDHNALVAIGASELDGSDVRLLYWDGTAWTELDRVLDEGSTWDQTDTTILFKTVSGIAANDADSYWLYYGNPAPAPVLDNPDNVYLLNEDFESGTLGAFEDRTGGTSWYQADPWTRRIPLTVDAAQVDADLGEFPVAVSLTNATLAALAQPDGSDIRFVAADGSTPLAHEIESYDAGTGSVAAWVRLPVVSSSVNTTFYLLFGAANAPDQADIRATWATPARAVWHLGRSPAGSAPQLDDATVNNHDGLSQGSMTGGDVVAARIGSGIAFDGVDDALVGTGLDVGLRGALSVSAWVRPDSVAATGRIVNQSGPATAFDLSVGAGGVAQATIEVSGSGVVTVSGGSVGVGAWHHLGLVWDGANARLYVDGAEVASQPATGVLVGADVPVAIGAATGGGGHFAGVIDEVRVETESRAAAWMAAATANGAPSSTFVSAGAAQTGTWFPAGAWAFRKPIRIDAGQVPATVTDAVLPVVFDDAEVAAAAQADGADLVVTEADGVTRLDHTLESYDAGTGAVRLWVRIPSIDATNDTQLFIYYGNPGAVDQQDPTATFGPDADLAFLGRS